MNQNKIKEAKRLLLSRPIPPQNYTSKTLENNYLSDRNTRQPRINSPIDKVQSRYKPPHKDSQNRNTKSPIVSSQNSSYQAKIPKPISFINHPTQRKSLLSPNIPSLLNKSQLNQIASKLSMSYIKQKTTQSKDSNTLIANRVIQTPHS
jgi:hypothetical protein